jgi:prolyl oligopeptidase
MSLGSEALRYPAARKTEQVDVYFGTAVADPYRWMEDLDSAELKAWVDAENALTQEFLSDVPARAKIHARLLELVNFERVGMPEREAGRLFFLRNTGLQNQSVLYWQEGEGGEARVLLDPNTLSDDGTVALGEWSVSEDGRLLAYALSEAGSDIQRVQVKAIDTGEERADVVRWVKFSGLRWAKDGSGFHYSGFGEPREGEQAGAAKLAHLKTVSEFHTLFFHRLGTPQSEDTVVFARPDDGEMLVRGGVTRDGRYLVLWSGKGHKNALALKDLERPEAGVIWLAPKDDAIYGWVGNVGTQVWLMTNKDAPKSRIVRVNVERPEQEHWVTVVEEAKDSLEDATMAGGVLLLTYLVDAQSKVEQRGLDGTLIREVELPGIGVAGVGGGRPEDTDVFFSFTNYTTPGTVYRLELETGATEVWRGPKLQFDPTAYETEQVFCTSKDGTRVPLFVTAKKGLQRDGTAPALLYGYGGFGVSLGPAYSSSRLAWLEMGGVYAEAILRGGGEYGEAWHEAGTKTRKQNVFDDFIACAEFLIGNQYTSARKLAINGGSNGGLLVAACAMQRPELFGAALAQVGVLDMLRFDQFTIGYAWKPDYGSPGENEEEFRAILAYSPLHNVEAGVRYPPMMITTGDHDDRVFPAHSFKFAAAMQAAAMEAAGGETGGAAPVLIRVETRAGHGGGMPLSKQLDVTADMYGFLVKELGMQAVA